MRSLHLVALLLLVACSGSNPSSVSQHAVDVTGTLTELVDSVPVDGGVDITVRPDRGAATAFYLPSFFTATPRPEEDWKIYEALTALRVGDRVRVTAEVTEYGNKITSVEKLNGRPGM